LLRCRKSSTTDRERDWDSGPLLRSQVSYILIFLQSCIVKLNSAFYICNY
jgi:hypothetical protein